MEAVQQARKLFLKYHQHQASLSDSDKNQLGEHIRRFITISIKEATSKDLFENQWMLDILKSALRQRESENSDVMPVARAFQSLEKYFILLVEQPWKAEFKEIKMYGGFYTTRIKSVIPDCESVFECAGYMVLPDSCTMIYKGPMHKMFLLVLAFDCRVAHVVCETIAEHYNKVRGLSMSLNDAISNILQDEYSRDKPALRYNLSKENGIIVNLSHASNVAPPALPKREPIFNSSRPNVRYESEKGIYNGSSLNMADRKLEAGIAFPPKSPNQTSDFYSSVLTRPPLTPLGVMPEVFTYMDAQTDEILPELPQGTSEDHMRESLKLVNLQESSDNWKQFRGSNDNKSATGSYQSNCVTPILHTGNICTQNHFKPAPSIDEGIEQDLPTSKTYSLCTKYGSIRSQQMVPNRQSASYQQSSFDQGYRTANPESIYSSPSTNYMHNFQQTIYHPPNIVTDGATHSKPFVSGQNAVPPPIPSRALKPRPVKDEDFLRNKMYKSAPHYTASQPGGLALVQGEVIVSRSPMSAPGYSAVPVSYNTEPVLRKERLALGKTNSLKIGGTMTPLAQQLASARTARSMDMTLTTWECQSCTTLNVASSSICCACSHSRVGPDLSHPTLGETGKSCSSCTFANNLDRTQCEMCGSKLYDKFTFV